MWFSKRQPVTPGASFQTVFGEELKTIESSRRKRGIADCHRPTEEDLIGLSFSGGGIRSATFNLGVIQAFANANLLSFMDYLSTVSGGGYIGSWLSSWAYYRRVATGPDCNHIAQVETELNRKPRDKKDKSEPDQVRYLRRYSNYLTPRPGLSGDTLGFAGTYIRNLALNQIILFAFAFALLGTPWILSLLLQLGFETGNAGLATLIAGILLLGWVLIRISRNLSGNRADPPDAVFRHIIVPEVLCCALLAVSVRCSPPEALLSRLVPGINANVLLVPVTAILYTLLWGIAAWQTSRTDRTTFPATGIPYPSPWIPVLWAFPAGLFAGVFLLLATKIIAGFTSFHLLTFGIPLGAMLVLMVGCIHLGLIGRSYCDGLREWWARLGGIILVFVFAWFSLCLVTLYLPLWMKLLCHLLTSPAPGWIEKLWKAMAAVGITGAAGGWLTVTLSGLFVAKGSHTGNPQNSSVQPPQSRNELLARLAPHVFIAGLLILFSQLLYSSFPYFTNAVSASAADIAHSTRAYWDSLPPASDWWKVFLFSLCLYFLVSRFLGWRVDVNEFSLHNAYRNRLVRCYLGATHPGRNAQVFTGFDESDNIPIHLLNDLGAPFHILNTTLNAAKSNDLALQERKAHSFVFTPLYSGFEYTGNARSSGTGEAHGCYRRTEDCSKHARPYPGARLGTAMAISGAAVSPNMGFYTAPAVSFLMTVFSVRLGWWLGNPLEQEWWESGEPRSSWRALMNELTATTTEEAREVYLSDGGHFDNLGLYELVRRRCRLIIACDAGADPNYSCKDLARVVEKCRVDFNAEISTNLTDLQPVKPLFPGDAARRASVASFSVGTIRYADGREGKLIYIKPCLSSDLPQDVLAYSRISDFPHQSTVDQFFDETQFESYRALGYACASSAVPTVRTEIHGRKNGGKEPGEPPTGKAN